MMRRREEGRRGNKKKRGCKFRMKGARGKEQRGDERGKGARDEQSKRE